MTWFEAAAYARWLGATLGGAWRLPTEAEWERAARGGLAGARTAWGDALPPGEVPDGPLAGPWPAGRGTPNGYGLLDMGTIVHEWCLDWYEEGVRRASRGRIVAAPRPLVAALGAEQPAARAPLLRLRLPGPAGGRVRPSAGL